MHFWLTEMMRRRCSARTEGSLQATSHSSHSCRARDASTAWSCSMKRAVTPRRALCFRPAERSWRHHGPLTNTARPRRRERKASFHPVLREIAEYPNSFGPLGPRDERIETDQYTLCMGLGKTWNTVQRQRFRGEEVDDVLEEVRSLLRARGRGRTQWEVGSSAEPPDLVDLLLARGLARDKDPYTVALVLTAPPPPAPGIVARRVETFE